jgi:hypothetical protein
MYVDLGAEEDLRGNDVPIADLAKGRLDELADHGNIDLANQVRHEHEPILEDTNRIQSPAFVVGADLAGNVGHPALDLLGSKNGLNCTWNPYIHERETSPEIECN